ncbi:MAG: metallophosphoesterase [Candidatus Odinarchaeota archaeon]|nr:metallophosphoesterase [Candidatus Odinarchaeota archaeon]
MKVLAITDIHGNLGAVQRIFDKDIQDINVILVCGDITHFGSIAKTEKILKEITKHGIPTYFVPGNCDNRSLLDLEELAGAINIHGRIVKINQLSIVGIGGSPITPFNTNIEFSENDFEAIIQIIEKDIEPNKWILCAHSPPYGTAIDLLFNGKHAGSRTIYKFIEKGKPLLSIHGHIHEARGIDKIESIPVVNPGPVRSKYYAIIKVSSSESPKIRIDLKRG